MKLQILALSALVLFCTQSKAQIDTGNDLTEKCTLVSQSVDSLKTVNDFNDAAQCEAYVRGVADTLQQWGIMEKNKPAILPCFPAGVTTAEMVRVIMKFLDDNPNQTHLPSALLAMIALGKAYPCH